MEESYYDKYNKFADACDIPRGTIGGELDVASILLAHSLVVEEWEFETKTDLAKYLASPTLENLVEVADGIADTIYVLCQLARSMGIPLNGVFDCVQFANMSKVGEDGKVRRREDGKILKPEGFVPPNAAIFKLLQKELDRKYLSENPTLQADTGWKIQAAKDGVTEAEDVAFKLMD
jgi:hypothetical protein